MVWLSTFAPAATVFVNDPGVTLTGLSPLGTTVMQGKYRLSHGNFDLSLSPYSGTGGGGTWISNNMGNVPALTGVSWDFVLSNDPGVAISWVFQRVSGTPTTVTQIWGTGGSATLNTTSGTPFGPHDRFFDTLRITARASQANASTAISNLAFTSPTLSLSAGSSFQTITVTPSTLEPPLPTFPADAAGFDTQWLLADVNLANYAWQLSGRVTLTRTGSGDGEAVRFTIDGLDAAHSAEVPEPAGAIPVVLALLWVYRTRRNQTGTATALPASASAAKRARLKA